MKKTIISLAAIAMAIRPTSALVTEEKGEEKKEAVAVTTEEAVDEYGEEADEDEENEEDWEEIQASFDEKDEKETRRRASAHYDHRQHYRY